MENGELHSGPQSEPNVLESNEKTWGGGVCVIYSEIENRGEILRGNRAQMTLCTAALLPELKPAPCFLSAIIGRTWWIQVCLIIVAVTTEVRHTWINQFVQ